MLLLAAASTWSLVALFRRLRRRREGVGSWIAFGVLAACGVALGIWCAFYCEYHVGANYRFGSFPIPIVFFHFEDGQWVDYPVPQFQAWAAAFANVVTITALSTLPLWLLARQHRHEKRELEAGRTA